MNKSLSYSTVTLKELDKMEDNKAIKRAHTATMIGYVSKKIGAIVKNYKGKFGEGFAVLTPSDKSSKYCLITYMIKTVI